MSKSLDISMHPIFLLATSMMIRNPSLLHQDLGMCFAMPARSVGMVPECHPCREGTLQGCYLHSLGRELTSTGHSGTKRVLAPPLALQTAVPGGSELERGVQSQGFFGWY